MKLSPEHRIERIALTRDAATALVEDLPHIREVVAKVDPSRGDLRRLSAVLRRILVERDLTNVASPRIGRIHLLAPDNKPFHKSTRGESIVFFASGGAMILGMEFRCFALFEGQIQKDPIFDLDAPPAKMRLDNFLAQHVLHWKGKWASRGDVITFAANVGSGVHSGTAKDEPHKLLSKVRHSLVLKADPTNSSNILVDLNVSAIQGDEGPLAYNPNAFDPILIELLCAAHFLTTSPDVIKLEETIKAELA